MCQQRLDPGDPVGGERKRLRRRCASRADSAAGPRGVADERFILGAALGAGRHVRQIAREPEKLELEREPERVESGRPGGMRCAVEEVEVARQRGERTLVWLFLAEEAQHRLGADRPH